MKVAVLLSLIIKYNYEYKYATDHFLSKKSQLILKQGPVIEGVFYAKACFATNLISSF